MRHVHLHICLHRFLSLSHVRCIQCVHSCLCLCLCVIVAVAVTVCAYASVCWFKGFSTVRDIDHGSRFITLWFDKNFALFGIVLLYFAFCFWCWRMTQWVSEWMSECEQSFQILSLHSHHLQWWKCHWQFIWSVQRCECVWCFVCVCVCYFLVLFCCLVDSRFAMSAPMWCSVFDDAWTRQAKHRSIPILV